jgi:hypothetical protein
VSKHGFENEQAGDKKNYDDEEEVVEPFIGR